MSVPCSFYIGKGGVGKSTSAALNAMRLAESGKKVLLVSLDPAHNLSDIFEVPSSKTKIKLQKNLYLCEIDRDAWIKSYLKEVQGRIRESYAYLTAFNLEHYFDVVKYSPGIEEYALFLAYRSIHKANSEFDQLIFDMPPTALALKFFSLPWLSLRWLTKLADLRKDILNKREIISRIKFGKKEIESDKVQNRLQKQITDYQQALTLFTNPKQSQIYLVLNPDILSLKESLRINDELQRLKIKVGYLVLNKSNREHQTEIADPLAHLPLIYQPQSSFNLTSQENLKRYLSENLD